jgi:hypothetical protein
VQYRLTEQKKERKKKSVLAPTYSDTLSTTRGQKDAVSSATTKRIQQHDMASQHEIASHSYSCTYTSCSDRYLLHNARPEGRGVERRQYVDRKGL